MGIVGARPCLASGNTVSNVSDHFVNAFHRHTPLLSELIWTYMGGCSYRQGKIKLWLSPSDVPAEWSALDSSGTAALRMSSLLSQWGCPRLRPC